MSPKKGVEIFFPRKGSLTSLGTVESEEQTILVDLKRDIPAPIHRTFNRLPFFAPPLFLIVQGRTLRRAAVDRERFCIRYWFVLFLVVP